MQNLRKSLIASIFLHLLPLLFFVSIKGCGGGGGDGSSSNNDKGKSDTEHQDIVEKPQKEQDPEPVEVDLVTLPSKPKPKTKHSDSDCSQFYGGLGIYEDTNFLPRVVISQAIEGYPGADLGLETGDEVLSPDNEHIKGEVGTTMDLVVLKLDGSVVTFPSVVRDKICIEGKAGP